MLEVIFSDKDPEVKHAGRLTLTCWRSYSVTKIQRLNMPEVNIDLVEVISSAPKYRGR